MKIHIKTNDGYNIKLRLPTSFIKSKLMLKILKKYTKHNIDFSSLPYIYKASKKYVKEHGHFTLVEVVDSEGNIVYITI